MSRYFHILILFLVVSCAPPSPLFVMPERDTSVTAAEAWSSDLETVADAVGIGQVLFQEDPRKLTGVDYCNEGNKLTNRGEFRRALRAKSKALYLAWREGDYMLAAHCAAGVALIYDYVDDHRRSQKWAGYAEDYLARAPERYGDIRPSYIKTMVLKVRADAARAERRFLEARRDMEAALEAAKENPPLIPWIKVGLANVLMANAEPDRAIPLLNQAIAEDSGAYQALARRTLGLIELDRSPDRAQSLFLDMVRAARAQSDDYMLCWAQRGLARVSLKRGDYTSALGHYQQAIEAANRVREWFHTEEFRSSAFGSLQDIFDEAVDLNTQRGLVVEAFEIAEQGRARSLRDMMQDTTRVTPRTGQIAAQVRDALPPDTTLISYYVLPGRLYAWKIDRASISGVTVEVDQARLRNLSQDFRYYISLSPPTPQVASDRARRIETNNRSLWEYLIRPLNVSRGSKLLIVPHRFLHSVPFAALRARAWLIQDHQLSFAPSAATWLQARSLARTGETLLAFSNPSKGGEPGDLQGAEKEVESIKRVMLQTVIASGPDASRERFTQTAARYDLLHFAVHGQLDKIEPGASALLLAGKTEQQGRLEARDIYRLPLPKASLVTMSACDTALGGVSKGDEVYSLTSAFIAAGAKSAITTFWRIADDVTARLMERFYQDVATGMEYAEALRNAQMAIATDPATKDPVFWAAFALVGSGGAIR